MNVHFICRGNAHRSVMADAYLKSLNLPGVSVVSSGTVADKYREGNVGPFAATKSLLKEHGLADFTKQSSEQLTQDRLHEDDVTVCFTQRAYDEGSQFVTFPKNTIIWEVSDTGEGQRILGPGDDIAKFDEDIFIQIKTLVDELAAQL